MYGIIRVRIIGVVGLLLLVGCGGANEDSYSCETSPTRLFNPVVSSIPASGDAPFKLTLNGSNFAGDDGVSIESYAWYLNASVHLRDGPGPHTVALPPGNHRIQLVTKANGNFKCLEEVVISPPGDESTHGLSVFDDRIITFDITGLEDTFDLEAEDGGFRRLFIQYVSGVLYTYFQDDFDFLMLMFNRTYGDRYSSEHNELGVYYTVQNQITGLGWHSYLHDYTREFRSEGRLQGVGLIGGRYGFANGTVLHEIMHRWGNRMIPVDETKEFWFFHWGFSSAYGQLGGFDLRYLQRAPHYDDDHGDAYEVVDGEFSPFGAHLPFTVSLDRYVKVYGLLELYLMGLIPLDDLPTIWATTDVHPVRANEGGRRHIYTVAEWEVFDQARVLQEFGPRNPPYGQAQTEFKTAVVLLVSDKYPVVERELDKLSHEVYRFGLRSDANSADETSFWEATGGRATMEMDRLSLSRKAVPTPPSTTLPSPVEFERLYSGHVDIIPPIY